MNYQLLQDTLEPNITTIIKTVDGKKFFIPEDSNNKDYQEYLEWVAEGNTAEPAEE